MHWLILLPLVFYIVILNLMIFENLKSHRLKKENARLRSQLSEFVSETQAETMHREL